MSRFNPSLCNGGVLNEVLSRSRERPWPGQVLHELGPAWPTALCGSRSSDAHTHRRTRRSGDTWFAVVRRPARASTSRDTLQHAPAHQIRPHEVLGRLLPNHTRVPESLCHAQDPSICLLTRHTLRNAGVSTRVCVLACTCACVCVHARA